MANGTIAFDTLTTSDSVNTGTEKSIDTSYLYNGSAKVWSAVASDGASFEDSFNTSSHTDTSTGLGTVNLSNSFTDTSYVCKGITRYLYNSLDGARVISIGARNTNSYSLQAGYLDSSARYVAEDRTRMASAYGDLA